MDAKRYSPKRPSRATVHSARQRVLLHNLPGLILDSDVQIPPALEALAPQAFPSRINGLCIAFSEMIQFTREIPVPHRLRTACSCAFLDSVLSEMLPPSIFSVPCCTGNSLIQQLKADVFSSIFAETVPSDFIDLSTSTMARSLSTFKGFVPYYTRLHTFQHERDSRPVPAASENEAVRLRKKIVLERFVTRWLRLTVLRCFVAWRNYCRVRLRQFDVTEEFVRNVQQRRLMVRCFSQWRFDTMHQKISTVKLIAQEAREAQEEVEHSLLEEYGTLVQGVEILREDKMQLAETVKKQLDEITQLRLELQQTRAKLEQSNAVTQTWKRACCELLAKVEFSDKTTPPPDPSSLVATELFGQPIETSGAQGILESRSQHELMVLQWVSDVAQALHPAGILRPASLMQFGDDFTDGRLLLDVTEYVQAATAKECAAFRSKKIASLELISWTLQKLAAFSDLLLSIDPLDVHNGKRSSLVYALLAKTMTVFYGCPLCTKPSSVAAVAPESISTTPTEAISRMNAISRSLRAWRATSERCLDHVSSKFRKQDSPSNASLFERVTIESMLGRSFEELVDGLPIAIIDSLTAVAGHNSSMLHAVYACFAPPGGCGMTSWRFSTFLTACKLAQPKFARRESQAIFELLDVDNRSEDSSSNSPARATLSCAQWFASIVYLAARSLARPVNPSAIGTALENVLAKVQTCGCCSGFEECRQMLLRREVQLTLSHYKPQTEKLYKFFAGLDSAKEVTNSHGYMHFPQFLAAIKALDSSLSSDSIKSLFEFLYDDPQTEVLSCEDFTHAMAAVAWMRYPQVWVSPSDRILSFLKRDLLTALKNMQKRPTKE